MDNRYIAYSGSGVNIDGDFHIAIVFHYFRIYREKMRTKGGLITQEQAIREIANVDIPAEKERFVGNIRKGGNIQLAEELKKIRLGVDDVDRLDMLIQHFVVVDNDDEDEEKGDVSNKNIA